MVARAILWTLMTACVLVVAGYSLALSSVSDLQSPFVRDLLAARPQIAVAHFFGGGVALLVGAFQLNARLRSRLPWLHRWGGRAYLAATMIGGVAGLILALHSFGGPVATAGFGLAAVVWLATTFYAYLHIRQGNVTAHRRWMIRGYAVILAAVTLRLYMPASEFAGIPAAIAYPAISWLCWVPNLLIAEWGIRAGYLASLVRSDDFSKSVRNPYLRKPKK